MLGGQQELSGPDWREVNALQASWHETRQRDFVAYLERSGKDSSDVNTLWPMAMP